MYLGFETCAEFLNVLFFRFAYGQAAFILFDLSSIKFEMFSMILSLEVEIFNLVVRQLSLNTMGGTCKPPGPIIVDPYTWTLNRGLEFKIDSGIYKLYLTHFEVTPEAEVLFSPIF